MVEDGEAATAAHHQCGWRQASATSSYFDSFAISAELPKEKEWDRSETAKPLLPPPELHYAPHQLATWSTGIYYYLSNPTYLDQEMNGDPIAEVSEIAKSVVNRSSPSAQKSTIVPYLVNCRLSSWTSISVLLNSFNSFRIAA